uniref:Uncharacterized protein n=1 Tax=Chrysemys picta bellii TaxID=8478 RepID=A0A8C3HM67_CHRPI
AAQVSSSVASYRGVGEERPVRALRCTGPLRTRPWEMGAEILGRGEENSRGGRGTPAPDDLHGSAPPPTAPCSWGLSPVQTLLLACLPPTSAQPDLSRTGGNQANPACLLARLISKRILYHKMSKVTNMNLERPFARASASERAVLPDDPVKVVSSEISIRAS